MVVFFAKKTKEILLPILGEFVTDSTIRVNCQRIGLASHELNNFNISEFAEKVRITLLLFINEEEAAEVVKKIKSLKIGN